MQCGWTADEATSLAVLTTALDAGVNFIDTADVYSRWVRGNSGGEAERIIGKWLKQAPGRRDQVVIATKVRGRMWDGPDGEGLSRSHIMRAVDDSLQRLGIETIDLYQLHSPDASTPIEETLRALEELIKAGKVRVVGCSNFTAHQTEEALEVSGQTNAPSFVSAQPHYNLVHRGEYEAELRAVCARHSLAVLPYSPLGSGFLTGKYRKGEPHPPGSRGKDSGRVRDLEANPAAWAALDVVRGFAESLGCSPSQVALAWLLAQPTVTCPIIGPRSIEQLEDNLGALEVELDPQVLQRLDEISDGL
jgi:aryl-alcohol dehydrogenase-like predicted oxidoreductase